MNFQDVREFLHEGQVSLLQSNMKTSTKLDLRNIRVSVVNPTIMIQAIRRAENWFNSSFGWFFTNGMKK